MANDLQVPWTDEQWARANQVIQEEAKRARVAATFLPLYGPLDSDADFVRRQEILYAIPTEARMAAVSDMAAANQLFASELAAIQGGKREFADLTAAQARIASAQAILGPQQLGIDDRDTMRLATLQVTVPVRNAQMADPEMSSVLALFRRAANVLARLEDAVVFRGLEQNLTIQGGVAPPAGTTGLPPIWQITGAREAEGIWRSTSPLPAPGRSIVIPIEPPGERSGRLVAAISDAIGRLEAKGHFGPFAAVLGQQLFLVAQTPDPGSLVLPQDRILPFLGGGPLLRSSTLDEEGGFTGVVLALGGAPIELVVATDMCLQFLQITTQPAFLFRVSEKIALRIKEPEAIAQLYMKVENPGPGAKPQRARGAGQDLKND
jgi:uncharacterized linocin/CFP29 family protein